MNKEQLINKIKNAKNMVSSKPTLSIQTLEKINKIVLLSSDFHTQADVIEYAKSVASSTYTTLEDVIEFMFIDVLNSSMIDEPSVIMPTFKVGTVTTGEAGTQANVTIETNDTEVIFNFTIPKGDKGEKGDKGDQGEPAPTSTK